MPAKKTSIKKKQFVPPLNIILLGDPAAGKATQAAMLVKKFNLFDLDMGKELNKLRATSPEVDKVLSGSTDKGNLTPTKIVRNIFKDIVSKVPESQGILFDGTPKMLGEAQFVVRLLKQCSRSRCILLYLHVPLEETVKRMQGRKGYFAGKFGKRADDSAEGLKNRVRYYRTNVTATVTFLQSKFPFEKISGLGTVRQVHDRIMKAINSMIE